MSNPQDPYQQTRAFNPPPQQYDPNRPPVPAGPPQQYGPPPPGYWHQPPAKKRRWPMVLGVSVAVLVGLCFFGAALQNFSPSAAKVSTKKPAAAGTSATERENAAPADTSDGAENFNLAAGTTITLTGGDGSVQETTLSHIRIHKGACGYGADPDNGSYLIADVTVEQVKGTGSANPLFFTFVGADGTTSDAIGGAFSGCVKNDMTSTNSLRAGAKRAGQIAFDVKSAAGTIEYAPGGLGADTIGSWKTG